MELIDHRPKVYLLHIWQYLQVHSSASSKTIMAKRDHNENHVYKHSLSIGTHSAKAQKRLPKHIPSCILLQSIQVQPHVP